MENLNGPDGNSQENSRRAPSAFDQTLNSFSRLFLVAAADARVESMLSTAAKIQTDAFATECDVTLAFTTKQQLFQSGLDQWLDSLAALTHKSAMQLVSIVGSYPEVLGTQNDPPKWVRSRLEDLLAKALGYQISPKTLNGLPNTLEAATRRPSPHLAWFWNVCDGLPDFDNFPLTGRPEPWSAPAWCWSGLIPRLWVRKGSPERLSGTRTEKIIRCVQRLFAGRLNHVLELIEDEVRVAMASSGKPDLVHSLARGGGQGAYAFHTNDAGGFLLSKYRSDLKRGILIQITQKPRASDFEICRGLDADGSVKLPPSWKASKEARSFAQAYLNESLRRRVEITISKVRGDLRKQGLLPPR